MSFALSAMSAVGACFFFTAAVLALLVDRLAGGRTRLWAYATAAFLLLAVERATNAMEWASLEEFAGFDVLQGYLSALVSVILSVVVLRFWYLFRKVNSDETGGN